MRNISNKNFITEGDKILSRHLRRRAEKEIARIDVLHANDTNRYYIKKIFLAHETWIEYKHFSDTHIKVTIHTPTGELNLDNINGLASGTRNFINSSGGFSRFFDRDEGLVYPKKVVDSIVPWLYQPPDPIAVPIFMKTPGKYTGEMRKVIQALIATGQYLYYEYKSDLCHGVYTAANDSKWIIEISAQGIFAAPMPLTEEPDVHTAWLGYSPLGPTSIDDLNLKRIASSSIVSAFFSKSPVFNACGWAFNANGDTAKNCCTIGGTGSGIATGFLYRISITETDNVPDNATMSLQESGQFALSRFSGMKVPSFDETQLEQTSHQDGQSDGLVFSAPRYVFFDGDVEKIVRSEGSGDVIQNNLPISLPWRDDINGRVYCASQPTGAYVCWPAYISDYANYPSGFTSPSSGNSVIENNIGTVIDGFESSPNISTVGDVWEESAELNPDTNGNVGADSAFPTWDLYKMHALRTQTTSSYRGHISYCIIPLGDRETVYQYQWDERISGYEYEAWDGTGRSSGTCTFVYGDIGDCKQVSNITEPREVVGFGNALQYSDFGMPVVGQDWCNYRSGWQDTFHWDYAQDATPPVRLATLSIVASGNIQELLWTDNTIATSEVSYNSDPDPENPQWMYVHRDNTQDGKIFGAKHMNATTYSKQFIIGIDEIKYPMISLPSFTINTFWVGDPHCVNNDCEE